MGSHVRGSKYQYPFWRGYAAIDRVDVKESSLVRSSTEEREEFSHIRACIELRGFGEFLDLDTPHAIVALRCLWIGEVLAG